MCEWSRRIHLPGGGIVTVATRGIRVIVSGMDRLELDAAEALGLFSALKELCVAVKDAIKHVMCHNVRGVIADVTRDDVTPTVGSGDTPVSQPRG